MPAAVSVVGFDTTAAGSPLTFTSVVGWGIVSHTVVGHKAVDRRVAGHKVVSHKAVEHKAIVLAFRITCFGQLATTPR